MSFSSNNFGFDPFQTLGSDLDDLSEVLGRLTSSNFTPFDAQNPVMGQTVNPGTGSHGRQVAGVPHMDLIDSLYQNLPVDEQTSPLMSSIAAQGDYSPDRMEVDNTMAAILQDLKPSPTSNSSAYMSESDYSYGISDSDFGLQCQAPPALHFNDYQNDSSFRAETPRGSSIGTLKLKRDESGTFTASCSERGSDQKPRDPNTHPSQQQNALQMAKYLAKFGQNDIQKMLRQKSTNQLALNSRVGVATKFSPSTAASTSTASASKVATNSFDEAPQHSFGTRSKSSSSHSKDTGNAAAATTLTAELLMNKNPETPSAVPKMKPKGERRTAHNLIEKRYRCSINDRIQELKLILLGDDSKLNKSAILRKAVDHITILRQSNECLRKENDTLKKALQAHGLSVPVSVSTSSLNVSSWCSPTESGADSSAPSSPFTQPSSPEESWSNATDTSPTGTISVGGGGRLAPRSMMDRSRVALFVLMACVVFFNPFKLMLDSSTASVDSGPAVGPGRTLQAAEYEEGFESVNNWWQENWLKPAAIWLINMIVIACVLARLLVHGEPVTDAASQSMTNFNRHKVQAEKELEKGNLAACVHQLIECLRTSGRPLPVTRLDQWAAFFWQIVRQALNRVWIGKWLSKQRRGGIKPYSVMQSHGRAAHVYHQLHQLHIIGYVPGGNLSGLTLALSAMNLAEAAGSTFPASELVEVYVLGALRARLTLPNAFGTLLMDFLLARARRTCHCFGVTTMPNVGWMFTRPGRAYFSRKRQLCELKTDFLTPFSCSGPRPACNDVFDCDMPLDQLTIGFKLEMLKELAKSLIYLRSEPTLDQWLARRSVNGYSYRELVEWAGLLTEASKPNHNNNNDGPVPLAAIADNGDVACAWWTNLLWCAVNWEAGDLSQAGLKYQFVRNVPKSLLTQPLALAVGHAFCARKICLEHAGKSGYDQLVWYHCTKSVDALGSCAPMEFDTDSLESLVMLLAYNWILQSLVEVWRNRLRNDQPYWKQRAPTALVAAVQRCLRGFRAVTKQDSGFEVKLLIYEIFWRMMSGANPNTTQHMYNRCSRTKALSSLTTDSDARHLETLKVLISSSSG